MKTAGFLAVKLIAVNTLNFSYVLTNYMSIIRLWWRNNFQKHTQGHLLFRSLDFICYFLAKP
jgi:hypothetical protein